MKEKSSKRVKKISRLLIGFLITAVIGYTIGYLSITWFPEASGGELFFIFPALIIFILLGYVIQILIHEAGHLVFGLLSGYQFSSFRVGNVVLFKQDGQFKTGKYSIPGTGGQCLMGPPAYNDGSFPFVLYNSGGVLMNLIATVVIGLFLFAGLSLWVNLAIIGFILGGLLTAATNGIPMTIGGIPNDAQNIRVMKEDKNLRYAFWFQLHANHLLTDGKRPKELELAIDDLDGIAETDLDQPLNTAIHLIRYNRSLDGHNFVEAKKILDEFAPYERNMMPLYQKELQFERLFLELVGGNRSEMVETLYTDELLKHAKRVKGWPNHKRVLMAYDWFHKRDKEKAAASYEELKKVAETHPVLGEVRMELDLAEYIKKGMAARSD